MDATEYIPERMLLNLSLSGIRGIRGKKLSKIRDLPKKTCARPSTPKFFRPFALRRRISIRRGLARNSAFSRAAIWARIEELRRTWYDIEASPHQGYGCWTRRMSSTPTICGTTGKNSRDWPRNPGFSGNHFNQQRHRKAGS